jgi:hypothetical protein
VAYQAYPQGTQSAERGGSGFSNAGWSLCILLTTYGYFQNVAANQVLHHLNQRVPDMFNIPNHFRPATAQASQAFKSLQSAISFLVPPIQAGNVRQNMNR